MHQICHTLYQYARFMESYRSLEKNTHGQSEGIVSLAKWRILNRLHDRNETLYYRVLIDNIKNFAPIIYTPTVGLVCQNYSGLFRRPRGMYFSAKDKGEMMSMIYNWPAQQVDMIVLTDGSRILGLGDLGVQGIGIPIGKLDMYVAAAGINPQRILPVMLDVGTNNQRLLEDPLYLGLRQPRLEGEEYLSIVDEFMEAVFTRWPKAIVQFEDFQMKWAFETLQRYRKRFCMFNDDIQGTAGVALALIFSTAHSSLTVHFPSLSSIPSPFIDDALSIEYPQTLNAIMETLPRPIAARSHPFPILRTRLRVNSSKPIFNSALQFPVIRFKPLSPQLNSQTLRLSHKCCVSKASDHNHDHHHHDQHHHHHCHEDAKLSRAQEAFIGFAKAIRWMDLADFLREHLQLCCCSAALFLATAACPYAVPKPAVKPLQNAFMLVAFPLVGVSASLDALTDIVGGKVNIHVLMALAAFASAFMGNPLEGGLLLAMFNLAHIAEEYFTSRSMVDVKELKENYPDFALVLDITDDKLPNTSDLAYKRVPVHNVEVDSYILVGAGESVPVDCEVFQGSATITIEHLTGEVKPLEIKVGDRIPGGARNLDGRMIVKATKTWKESTLSKIVQLTEEAQLKKPKLQRWLDEFGEHYSKVVVVLSIAVAVIGPFLFKWPFISTPACRGSVYRALGLMVAASPCALAVAPLAYATAISSCARKGILLKGGLVLDALASCHTIAFDKTGTLTTGGLAFKAIEPIYGHHVRNNRSNFSSCCVPSCEKEALAVAAAMEKGTTHPIGRAVVDHSVGKDLPSVSIESFEYFPGRGLIATLNSIESGTRGVKLLKALLGSVDFITSFCKSADELRKIKDAVNASSYGNEFVHAALSVDQKVTLIHLEDRPRPGVSDVIGELRDQAKLHVMMLTGDHKSSAWRVANAVGINEVYCSLKPEDKLSHLKDVSRNMGGGLIMVGEGINDAPALAAATVGIVLAQRASATAIAVADVLLLRDNISGVPFCIAKSRQTTSLVKQNVALALSSIFLASLPSVLGFLPLWLTVLLHEGGTLLVCLNSVRALNDPSWSWRQDLLNLINEFKSRLLLSSRRNSSSDSIQATATR